MNKNYVIETLLECVTCLCKENTINTLRALKKDNDLLHLLKELIKSGEIKICEDTLIDYPEIEEWLKDGRK